MIISNALMKERKVCVCCNEKIRGKYAIRLSDEGEGVWLNYNCREQFVLSVLGSRKKGPDELQFAEHDKKLKILDLFSGRKGWTKAFEDRGHYVLTVDIDEDMDADITEDILNLTIEDVGTDWDIVLASPPCQCFSIASCMHHWSATEPRVPKSEAADNALQLVQHTYDLIQEINPVYWAMENPRAMLRKLWKTPTLTTHFSAWSGGNYEYRRPKKPTDLWGVFPKKMLWPEPRRWELAPRGAQSGTQGLASDEAARIPYNLSFTLCINAEEELLYDSFVKYRPSGSTGERIAGKMDKWFRLLPFIAEKNLIEKYW